MGRRVLVTGGAGFIGSNLVDALLARGDSVVCLDNFSTGNRRNVTAASTSSQFKLIEADVSRTDLLADACSEVEVVFHLAALADIVPSIERPEAYFRANVDGTFAVVEAARRSEVRRLVYAASSSCYGLATTIPTPEEAPIAPQYPYALTKYLGEQMVLHWGMLYGLQTVALRLFNVYGPRARTTGTYGAVFGVFLAQKLAAKPFTVVGDGEQTRDFTYVSDVVKALLAAADAEQHGIAVNIGSGGTYSINRLVELLGGQVTHIPKRPGEPDCTFADIRRAEEVLGWSPEVSFEDGVGRLLENIDDWRDAPVWDSESIAKATQAWFKYLSTPAKVVT